MAFKLRHALLRGNGSQSYMVKYTSVRTVTKTPKEKGFGSDKASRGIKLQEATRGDNKLPTGRRDIAYNRFSAVHAGFDGARKS